MRLIRPFINHSGAEPKYSLVADQFVIDLEFDTPEELVGYLRLIPKKAITEIKTLALTLENYETLALLKRYNL